jgi:hypothetical protein
MKNKGHGDSEVGVRMDEGKETAPDKDKAEPEKKKDKPKLATIEELFSFGTTKTKMYMMYAMVCSVVTGAVFPAMAFYFAKGKLWFS